MIRAGADVNEAQPDGTRPIHWAVYRVDYELMDALIAKKAKVDVTNEFGYTPLAEADETGRCPHGEDAPGAGSGTEGANADGQTALMIAIKNGDLPVFQMLIDAGAKVNVVEKVQDQTPLMWAAAATRNAAEMVKVLIAKGANVNARAKFNDWPSQITSEPRAQYHAYGGLTPLLYAARGGCYACVEALVGAGADVNLPTPEGVTPMMIALDNSHNGVAKFFLEHGANPHVWDVYGRTALYIAVDHAAAVAPPRRCGGGRDAAVQAARGGAPGGARRSSGSAWAQALRRRCGAVRAAGAGGRRRCGRAAVVRAAGGGGGGGGAAGSAADSGPQVSSMEIINLLLAAGVIRIRNSTCVVPAIRADVSAIRSSVRARRRCCAPWSVTTPKSRGFCWRRARIRTSTAWGFRRGCMLPALPAALTDEARRRRRWRHRQYGASGSDGRAWRRRECPGERRRQVFRAHRPGVDRRPRTPIQRRNDCAPRRRSIPEFESGSIPAGQGARTDIIDASGRTPLDVLNGVPALPPAVNADADGVVPPNAECRSCRCSARWRPVGRRRWRAARGNPAAVQEIRAMLQAAPQSQSRSCSGSTDCRRCSESRRLHVGRGLTRPDG